MSDLAQWESFYVIIGSAAGALIGLQFVVMTLIADRPRHLRLAPHLRRQISFISLQLCFYQRFYAFHGKPSPL